MRLSSFWFTGKEKADFWRKHSRLSHTKHALASSLIFFLHMLLILQLLCGCCLMHFVFTPVTFNDICIEHFSKYCVKKIFFLTESHLQEQNSRKKRVTCSINPPNHNMADKQLLTSLLQKSVHHPSTAQTPDFISIIASRRGTWEHELSLVLKPLWTCEWSFEG